MNKENKKRRPLKRGIARLPVILQIEATESGEAALAMVLSYFGKITTLEKLKARCGAIRDGLSAEQMLKLSEQFGLSATMHSLEAEALKGGVTLPCIIGWKNNQYAVLRGFLGSKALIHDTEKGSLMISAEDLKTAFSGLCLTFETSDSFVADGMARSSLNLIAERMRGAWDAVAFMSITMVLISLIGIVKPAFTRVLVDRLLTGQNPEWLTALTVCMCVICIAEVILLSIQRDNNLRLNAKLDTKGNMDFMWKTMHLPMEYFSHRSAGDIQKRKHDSTEIANTMIAFVAPMVINALMTVAYLIVMLRNSVALTLIAVAAILISTTTKRLAVNRKMDLTRLILRQESALYSTTVSGIGMIESIKACGAESSFFERLADCQGDWSYNKTRNERLENILNWFIILIPDLANAAVMGIGAILVMNGELSIGLVLVFQAYITALMKPTEMLLNGSKSVQEMRTQMELIDDVLEYPNDESYDRDSVSRPAGYYKIMGDIEIKALSFGYSKFKKPLIDDFSLTIKQGSSVAIVGASGCGKSTIAKLLSGLYHPWSGEILFDGRDISSYDRNLFIGSVAVIDQDICLFEDSISNNIKMWDDSIEDFEVILAAKDAGIHEDIMKLDKGYEHILKEKGSNLSGGQRQRIEIARVLAMEPTVIILDEATSMLDAKTEHSIVKAIRNRGITCITIAHRLSTVRSCDEIVVLDGGAIVEKGTHSALMEKGGLYSSLVKSE